MKSYDYWLDTRLSDASIFKIFLHKYVEDVCFTQKPLFIFRFLLSWSQPTLLDPKIVFLWKSQEENKEIICHQLIKSLTPYWNNNLLLYVNQFSDTCFIYSQDLVDVWFRLKYKKGLTDN